MCDIHMLHKTRTVCLRVAEPHLIYNRICICKFQTHMCCLLPEDLVLALEKVLSICPTPILPPILSGSDT